MLGEYAQRGQIGKLTYNQQSGSDPLGRGRHLGNVPWHPWHVPL